MLPTWASLAAPDTCTAADCVATYPADESAVFTGTPFAIRATACRNFGLPRSRLRTGTGHPCNRAQLTASSRSAREIEGSAASNAVSKIRGTFRGICTETTGVGVARLHRVARTLARDHRASRQNAGNSRTQTDWGALYSGARQPRRRCYNRFGEEP